MARFYYTTYDVQQAEDVINPRTSHCDVMLLADLAPNNKAHSGTTSIHPFLYGRVIGIYHANVVYIGPGMKDYDPMHFDLLYIRWFHIEQPDFQENKQYSDWASLRLNCLSFPSMTGNDSFGFMDPSLVLRGCHIIPAFFSGKRHPSGIGFSSMSKDGNDWRSYYVNRSEAFTI